MNTKLNMKPENIYFDESTSPHYPFSTEILNNLQLPDIGKYFAIQWILVKLNDNGLKKSIEEDNSNGIFYQEIILLELEQFSDILDVLFFESIANNFHIHLQE